MDPLFFILGFITFIVTVYSYVQFARGKDSPDEKLYRGDYFAKDSAKAGAKNRPDQNDKKDS